MLPKPINIDRALTLVREHPHRKGRIKCLGIELEGGWNTLPRGTTLVRDGSVHVRAEHVGELPSPPLEVGEWEKWVRKFYPSIVDASCGLHVHTSFLSPFSYQRLLTPLYPATVVGYFKRWAKKEGLPLDHPIWPRLAGKSRYCQHTYHAEGQILSRGKDYDQERVGHRYTVINYCWGTHSTVECRLLPMMGDVDLAVRAINELMAITNAFLIATAKREVKVEAIVELEGGVEEETMIHV